MGQTSRGNDMKSFDFKHLEKTYTVSLDELATRKMEPDQARDHINTDSIYLIEGKTVGFFKESYNIYRNQGGKLKKLAYLNKVAKEQFGVEWSYLIEYAKTNMRNEFNSQVNWVTKEDHIRLNSLAMSGHAFAAYTIGCQLMKQDKQADESWAVKFLVDAHNYGHIGGLYRLSGYLARKGNYEAALVCLAISADCGNDCALFAIPHTETLSYLAKSNTSDLISLLGKLSDISPFSTARYLQFIVLLLSGGRNCLNMLNDIILSPQKKPKAKFKDEYYKNREKTLSDFFLQLRSKLVNNAGNLKDTTVEQRLKVYRELASSEAYHFICFADFMELDKRFNP